LFYGLSPNDVSLRGELLFMGEDPPWFLFSLVRVGIFLGVHAGDPAAIVAFPWVQGRPCIWRLVMNLTALIIQLIAGALGGHAAGAAAKDINLGPLGNTIAGAIGGGVGGQILNAILGLGGATAVSGMDIGSIVSAFLTGGVSGGVTALVVGFLKAKLAS
jgi:hypothetical protein